MRCIALDTHFHSPPSPTSPAAPAAVAPVRRPRLPRSLEEYLVCSLRRPSRRRGRSHYCTRVGVVFASRGRAARRFSPGAWARSEPNRSSWSLLLLRQSQRRALEASEAGTTAATTTPTATRLLLTRYVHALVARCNPFQLIPPPDFAAIRTALFISARSWRYIYKHIH